jgi:hypothetical protein
MQSIAAPSTVAGIVGMIQSGCSLLAGCRLVDIFADWTTRQPPTVGAAA